MLDLVYTERRKRGIFFKIGNFSNISKKKKNRSTQYFIKIRHDCMLETCKKFEKSKQGFGGPGAVYTGRVITTMWMRYIFFFLNLNDFSL